MSSMNQFDEFIKDIKDIHPDLELNLIRDDSLHRIEFTIDGFGIGHILDNFCVAFIYTDIVRSLIKKYNAVRFVADFEQDVKAPSVIFEFQLNLTDEEKLELTLEYFS